MAPSEDFRLLPRSSPVFSSRFLYHEQYVVAISLFSPFSLSYLGTFSMQSSGNQRLYAEAQGSPANVNTVLMPIAAPLVPPCEETEDQAQ